LKKIFRRAREDALFLGEFYRDMVEFRESATPTERTGTFPADAVQVECLLTKDYHRVEKGLSLATPKRPFGNLLEKRLSRSLANASATGLTGPGADANRYASDALQALRQWNETGVVDDTVSPTNLRQDVSIPPDVLESFFAGRASVRNFARGSKVSIDEIEKAVELAQNTPSVCNRQAARVHVVMAHNDVQLVLAEQNGNSGFRDSVPHVAIVTVDRRLFSGPEERNQRWIDGGLYAMSFVWALHGLGIGSCMLNWSVLHEKSATLRDVVGIDANEDIICLIAFGYPNDGLRRARSPRRPSSSVLRFVPEIRQTDLGD
jgi:nitroreductase